MKRISALLLCLCLFFCAALAEIEWPTSLTSGQAALRHYVDQVNLLLTQHDAGVINMQYELYEAFANLGMDGADAPEDVEIYFLLGDDGLHSLTLRLCDPDRFETVSAACLTCASPLVKWEDAQSLTKGYADILRADLKAKQTNPQDAMTHSFEEDINDLQGSQPRAYFAYYPNQFGDGRHWLQMTLIFPRPGSEAGPLALDGATPAPPTEQEEYEGYFSQDNYTHLEVFVTPTPEPDSAAMEP